MRSVVICDMRDYVKKHWRLLVASMAALLICFGFLVFSGNIRIDTEELMNHPGSNLGWLAIGRWSLALFKKMLGLSAHNTLWSGILFFLFFWIGANLLTFALYHFSGKRENLDYWIFLMLYVTSNIWCYQIYFSLQQAEIAFAMLLLVIAAILAMRLWFVPTAESGGVPANAVRCVVSAVLLFLGLGAYQALAVYYITICLALFLVMEQKSDGMHRTWSKSLGLILHFGIVYVVYRIFVKYCMTSSDYMESQMGWGRYGLLDCVKNILRTAKNILLGYGPRNFSFYGCGVVILLFVLFVLCKRKRQMEKRWQRGQIILLLCGVAGILLAPFLMTIYMGEMLVTRSQFGLPVAAAFLGMYGIRLLRKIWEDKETQAQMWLVRLCELCVILTITVQVGYDLRLTYTDQVRYTQDKEKTDTLLAMLQEENGGVLPEQPVIFVGYQECTLPKWCRRTEMYGWSFYGWDYSKENPTGATHRISGFVQAYTGQSLREDATEEEKNAAIALSETMADFPAAGSVCVTEDFVVVRLSEITESTELDWW